MIQYLHLTLVAFRLFWNEMKPRVSKPSFTNYCQLLYVLFILLVPTVWFIYNVSLYNADILFFIYRHELDSTDVLSYCEVAGVQSYQLKKMVCVLR